jgi:hypothetical protein
MDGSVTSYNSGTGALVVNVTGTGGSGTFTSWSVRAVSPSGLVAGSTITTATTLTASDENLRAVNMSTLSQSVTLPNATSISAGRQYTFDNIGGREFGIRDNTGRLIARVGSNLTVTVCLVDNATAAGTWAVEGQDALLPLTICDNTFSSTYTATAEPACRLTDTLSLHIVRNSSGHPFVVAVDHSTFPATVGTPTIIVASSATVVDIRRVSNTKAVVAVATGGSDIYNISVSGTVCTVSSSGAMGSGFFGSFIGAPTVCNLTDSLIVGIRWTGSFIEAQAANLSGANPSVGTALNIASGGRAVHGVYRITDTTALAIYTDDSGTAGSPFSLRAVVLTVSGTSVSVGSSAGRNDLIVDASSQLPSCQLSTTSYMVSFRGVGDDSQIVHIGVSGTTVTFGSPLTVEASIAAALSYTSFNGSRFQPNLFLLTSTTALMTYADGSNVSRHVVITNSGGTLTAGSILYRVWNDIHSGNFPQRSDRFMTISNKGTEYETIRACSISGTTITQTDAELGISVSSATNTDRFGISGDYFGIRTEGTTNIPGRFWNLFKFSSANTLQYLGRIVMPLNVFAGVPVELAFNRVAFIGARNIGATTLSSGDPLYNLVIWEFPL